MKREWNKREKIIDRTFDFTQQKVQYQIAYNGNGKAPDKRFDKSTEGLCLFIYPSGNKVFYAVRFLEMYNRKKNRTEKNAVYKKIFRMEDHPQRNYAAAKIELPNILSLMAQPKEKKDEKAFRRNGRE